jgi:sugar phosphate isomerase/epimerase
MTGRLISLAAGVILDVGPERAIEVAAEANWPAVGIWFDPQSWTATTATDVRRRLDDLGIIPLDIEPIMLGPSGDHGDAIIDAAVAINARNILVASRDSDNGRVADRLGALADRLTTNAPGTNTRIVLEFLPALGVKTLAQASAIVEQVGRPELGILIDSLHLSRANETPDDVALAITQSSAHRFPYLQLADAPHAPPATDAGSLIDEALHGRLLPGHGELPLSRLLAAVPHVPVSVELRSRELMTSFPDPTERARAVKSATERVLNKRV